MNAKTRKKIRSRKYDNPVHKNLRASFKPAVDSGLVDCARCGELIEPGTMWDLGHDDVYPELYSGPEHASCNRSAPHRNVTSRQW